MSYGFMEISTLDDCRKWLNTYSGPCQCSPCSVRKMGECVAMYSAEAQVVRDAGATLILCQYNVWGDDISCYHLVVPPEDPCSSAYLEEISS